MTYDELIKIFKQEEDMEEYFANYIRIYSETINPGCNDDSHLYYIRVEDVWECNNIICINYYIGSDTEHEQFTIRNKEFVNTPKKYAHFILNEQERKTKEEKELKKIKRASEKCATIKYEKELLHKLKKKYEG